MVSFIIGVDLDRDAPFPVKGIPHAVSMPLQGRSNDELRDPGSAAAIEGTRKGLSALVELLRALDIPAVFFHEARTAALLEKFYPEETRLLKTVDIQHGLHGLDHEDYSGKLTGVQLSKEEQRTLLEEGKKLVRKSLGETVSIFRAPYMEPGEHVFELLVESGIYQDSSQYREAAAAIEPVVMDRLVEYPVIKTPKHPPFDGMYTYLWPLFERTRTPGDVTGHYLSLLANSKKREQYSVDTGFISLNLHPWHLAYFVKEKRYFTEKEMIKNMKDFKQLLLALKKTGEEFTTFDVIYPW